MRQWVINGDETLREVQWAPKYAVSNLGNVYRIVTKDGVCEFVRRKAYLAKVGYYVVTVQGGDPKCYPRYIHRLVAEAFLPAVPKGHEVRHLDGNALNNRVKNLAWGTRRDNVQDTIKHGRHRRGKDVVTAKLSEKDVQIIRYLLVRGASVYSISAVFGVADATVAGIRNGRLWAHLPLVEEHNHAEDQRDTEHGGCKGVLLAF